MLLMLITAASLSPHCPFCFSSQSSSHSSSHSLSCSPSCSNATSLTTFCTNQSTTASDRKSKYRELPFICGCGFTQIGLLWALLFRTHRKSSEWLATARSMLAYPGSASKPFLYTKIGGGGEPRALAAVRSSTACISIVCSADPLLPPSHTPLPMITMEWLSTSWAEAGDR